MAVEPQLNCMYKLSKVLSDNWLQDTLRMDNDKANIWNQLDIAFMSAISAPHADLEMLKLMNDWNGWVFAFDDPFDEGYFAKNPTAAAEEVIRTLFTLDNNHPIVPPEESPVRHALQSCWMRFRERASPTLQYRWKQQLIMYFVGVLQQIAFQTGGSRSTVEEYMDIRAQSVGVYPCIGLMEKDLIKGEQINIIFILKDQGMTTQQAVDQIGEMLHDCYRRWHNAKTSLPSWGVHFDRSVERFVRGCQNIALGNLHWSFHTFRYMGKEGYEAKRTGVIDLPEV
ncbi:uncharacterized protein FIESC28_05786 [Fusarium coffeatum]|uniref:Terpene synthase n=1 Tax=Fusarium coffeatum TaxID=231269 RepID=A0A366RPC9_9HYPO|nr:uncharacterized protein FIESC28_05786 [Fusarium coffeatum]RBR18964.1 hypothetical protein FIESC28_05786 [Fusarium coffeatum]